MVIETVTLCAEDLGALRAFYGDRLGLPVALHDRGERLAVTVGSSQIVFQHEAGFAGRYHFAFNTPENRLAAAMAFLRARGAALIAASHGESLFEFGSWDAHALYFYDVAGNIAECIARHELANTSPTPAGLPFSPAELQCVSEIGLPVDTVAALAVMLSEALGIGAYRESSPEFMPLGDADGLLILVSAGRVWFPDTGIAAETLPVQAVICSDAGTRFAVQGTPYCVTAL